MDVPWLDVEQGIGLSLGTARHVDGPGLVDLASFAEGLGYGSFWVPEDNGREAFAVLGALVRSTRRAQLGTGIVGVYGRTPALTAQAIATVDELSGGRAFLALGLGSLSLARDWHMAETRHLARRLREYAESVRVLLRGAGSYEGQVYRGRNLQLTFSPPRSQVPLFVASLSSQTLEVVRDAADGWLPMVVPLGYVQQVRQQLAARMPVALYTIACADEDREVARRYARQLVGFFLATMPALRGACEPFLPPGEAAGFLERWRSGPAREATRSLSDGLLDTLAIAGTPAECRDRLALLRAAGVYPVIAFPYVAPKEVIETTLRALAPRG